MSRPADLDQPPAEPFDLLDAATTALWRMLDEVRAELPPLPPLRDDEPAPLFPPVEQP